MSMSALVYQQPRIESTIPLRKPRRRDHGQLLPQLANTLRTIRHHHDRLLHRRPRNIRWPIEEGIRIDLSRTRDAEEGGRGLRGCLFATEGEV